jgi:signal transduction histidine kinase
LVIRREAGTRHIIKGRPVFKRHLYISTILFVLVIVLVTLLLIRLTDDVFHERIDGEITLTCETLSQQIRDQIQNVNWRIGGKETTSENQYQKGNEIRIFIDGLVAQQEELIYIFVQNLQGDILWTAVRQGMELEQNQFSQNLFTSRDSRPPKIVVDSLTNIKQSYLDIIEPIVLNDQPQLIVHVGIDPRLMEIRFAGFRTSVLNRIWLGSSLVVSILTLALFYVLWLLKRAQTVEAEAHMADQLAYLGTLASGLAHEIRNPLNAINLNLQMIEEEIKSEEPNSSETGLLLEGAKQEIRRLDRLATNFLFFAKPFKIEKHSLDLNELLKEVAELVARECEASQILLQILPAAFSIALKGDRDLLKQAILNLVVNAQDVLRLKKKGERVITMSSDVQNGEAFLRIADNGKGIGPDEAKNLFKLFYSTKRGGTGLGLPIAQRIVESHGGRIEWKNLPEGGVEFSIWLNT